MRDRNRRLLIATVRNSDSHATDHGREAQWTNGPPCPLFELGVGRRAFRPLSPNTAAVVATLCSSFSRHRVCRHDFATPAGAVGARDAQ